MIGVTVGVGTHRELAEEAAELFRSMTGYDAVVLSDEHMERVGCTHPYNLRMYLYDFVPQDRVTYFDADLFFIRPWDPAALVDEGEVGVVHDLHFAHHILVDCLRVSGTTSSGYFNSGLMVIDPSHEKFLRTALRLSTDVCLGLTAFCDQTALNMAAKVLEVPVKYLDRRYNWTQTAEFCTRKGYPIIGLHKPSAGSSAKSQIAWWERAKDVLNVPCDISVERSDFQDMAGLYNYERVGFDQRCIELLPNGNIGRGASRLETMWMPVRSEGKRGVIVRGHRHNLEPFPEIETFKCFEDTDGCLRGSWNEFEEMPICLTRVNSFYMKPPRATTTTHRAEILKRILNEMGLERERLLAAELGVYRGETSSYLLSTIPSLDMVLVDTWGLGGYGTGYQRSGDRVATLPRKALEEIRIQALRSVSFAEGRVRILQKTTDEAAVNCAGVSFDLVFVDADHSYASVKRDIVNWWSLVRSGGVLAGHDYNYPDSAGERFGPEVAKAVDEFVDLYNLELHLEDDYVWWVRKP